jgi:6-phosphogluconate dehydrogenase
MSVHLLCAFFWVILRTYPPMKMEQTECSETLAYKIQTPGNYPEESIQHSEHGESLKSSLYISQLVYLAMSTMSIRAASNGWLWKLRLAARHFQQESN